MKRSSKIKDATLVKGLEGSYIRVDRPVIRLGLEDGRYKWGSRDIHEIGAYTIRRVDQFSCIIEFSSELDPALRRRCRMTRRGKIYTVKELPKGEETRFKRADGAVFLADSPATTPEQQAASATVHPPG